MGRTGVVLTCFESTGTEGDTTGTAIGDVKAGGNFNIDPNVLQDVSVDGVVLSQGGLVKTTFEVEMNRPVKQYLIDMLRATASHSVSTKTFVVGTEGGRVAVSGCQPSGFTASIGVDEIWTWRLGYWGLRPVETASGTTAQPSNSSGSITDGWSDVSALLGTSGAGTGSCYDCQRVEIRLNTNPIWHASLCSADSGVKRIPTAIYLGCQAFTVTYDAADKIAHADSSLVADAIDYFYLTLGGSTVDFALDYLPTPAEAWEFVGPNDKPMWRYQFEVPCRWGTGIVA